MWFCLNWKIATYSLYSLITVHQSGHRKLVEKSVKRSLSKRRSRKCHCSRKKRRIFLLWPSDCIYIVVSSCFHLKSNNCFLVARPGGMLARYFSSDSFYGLESSVATAPTWDGTTCGSLRILAQPVDVMVSLKLNGPLLGGSPLKSPYLLFFGARFLT